MAFRTRTEAAVALIRRLPRPGIDRLIISLLETRGNQIQSIRHELRTTTIDIRGSDVFEPAGQAALIVLHVDSHDKVGVRPIRRAIRPHRQRADISQIIVVTPWWFTSAAERYPYYGVQLTMVDRSTIVEWLRFAEASDSAFLRSFAEELPDSDVQQSASQTISPEPGEPAVQESTFGEPTPTNVRRIENIPFQLLWSIANAPDAMRRLAPRQFEEFVAELISRIGFVDIELTPQSRDGGRDIIAQRFVNGIPLTFLLECKRYAETHPVGVGLMRELLGVVAHENANIGVLVTTSRFTDPALALMKAERRLDGKDYLGVTEWLREWLHGSKPTG